MKAALKWSWRPYFFRKYHPDECEKERHPVKFNIDSEKMNQYERSPIRLRKKYIYFRHPYSYLFEQEGLL